MMGQLPMEHITPDAVFDKVGVHYAGSVFLKHGSVCKPTIIRACICVFLYCQRNTLELESDFNHWIVTACLWPFTGIACHSKPSTMLSDRGIQFHWCYRAYKIVIEFLQQQGTSKTTSNICSCQNTDLVFVPERPPHFDSKACLNCRPLPSLPDGVHWSIDPWALSKILIFLWGTPRSFMFVLNSHSSTLLASVSSYCDPLLSEVVKVPSRFTTPLSVLTSINRLKAGEGLTIEIMDLLVAGAMACFTTVCPSAFDLLCNFAIRKSMTKKAR